MKSHKYDEMEAGVLSVFLLLVIDRDFGSPTPKVRPHDYHMILPAPWCHRS